MANKGSVRVSIDGGEELQALFKKLPIQFVKKHLRRAMTVASTPTLKEARQSAPRRTGLLEKSMGRRVKMYRSGVVSVVIGPKSKFSAVLPDGRVARPSKYAHLVEFGTAPHKIPGPVSFQIGGLKITAGEIDHPGSNAKPFMGPALDRTSDEATRKAAGLFWDGVKQAAKEASKQ